MKWNLRYLLKTVDVRLVFEQDDICNHYVIGYFGDLDKRWLTTGYVFTLVGAPMSWKSTLQSTVALSTTEVEYMTLIEGVKEVIWLGGLLNELGVGKE